MEQVWRSKKARLLLVAVFAAGTTTALVLRADDASSDLPPTAEEVVADKQPTGDELAGALGLTLEPKFSGNCDFFAEVTEDGAGYCLEGLGESRTDQVIFAEALRGDVLTPEQVELVTAELAANEEGSDGDFGGSST